MIAFIGVRSSWLMVETNWLFNRLASRTAAVSPARPALIPEDDQASVQVYCIQRFTNETAT